jgi:hypothetical protein
MNTFSILLMPTRIDATIEIIALLLGAGIIGYVTAWLYYKSELLKRIRDRQDRIYFDRLGIAHKHEANNLTLIDGLGLWVEERLNLLGIYTFDQISKLTHKDIETITEVLEIIPGRIEQDNWVSQARELAKKQVHQDVS